MPGMVLWDDAAASNFYLPSGLRHSRAHVVRPFLGTDIPGTGLGHATALQQQPDRSDPAHVLTDHSYVYGIRRGARPTTHALTT